MIKIKQGAYILFLNTLKHGEISKSDNLLSHESFVLGEEGENKVQKQ